MQKQTKLTDIKQKYVKLVMSLSKSKISETL